MKIIWRAMLVLAAFAFAAPAEAQREAVTRGDTRAVRAVVEAQLAAFAADDAAAAFAHAAPSIRALFANPDAFLAMVRAGYPVVYRPRSVSFLLPVWVDGSLLQGVHMTDAQGALWLAVYQLERQADKSWRIGGCTVQPVTGQLT
ncbi:MAG: DUF4864 domain-containing protein [Pseudomonadota bacterium]|nr:DUF4864 domain-containing protein [Pseudomonadota bacterium]